MKKFSVQSILNSIGLGRRKTIFDKGRAVFAPSRLHPESPYAFKKRKRLQRITKRSRSINRA